MSGGNGPGVAFDLHMQEFLRRQRQKNEEYRVDFLAFLRDCIWTVDEARGGETRQWPMEGHWLNYWQDWNYALASESVLLIDKTRRTMASNVCCAWDLWVASGGVDERWPALLRSTTNRRVIIQSRKLEDAGGSAEFVDRIRMMYEIAVDRGLYRLWPSFPRWKFYFGKAKADNGGRIDAVPQGPDQTRGAGITLLHAEEISFWTAARETMEVAIPTIAPEGHVVAVTTPAAGTYAADIRAGQGRKVYYVGGAIRAESVKASDGERIETPGAYLPLKRMPNEWSVLVIRGADHVPGYDPMIVGKGMSEHVFRRDVLGDWTATVGKVIYPEFSEELHVSKHPLPFDPDLTLTCGWDFPAHTGGILAFVPTQLTEAGQWLIYPPVVQEQDESIGVYEFCERVAEYLQSQFATPCGKLLEDLTLTHYADPIGNSVPANPSSSTPSVEAASSYEIARRGIRVIVGFDSHNRPLYEDRKGWGWTIRPGAVSITDRLEAVRARLTRVLPGGKPALLIDPRAGNLLEGFRGGYSYGQRSDGTYDTKPLKNKFADSQDALAYAASRLFSTKKPEREDHWLTELVGQTKAGRRPPPGRRRW